MSDEQRRRSSAESESASNERRELVASIFIAVVMAALLLFAMVRARVFDRSKLRGPPKVIWGANRIEPEGNDNTPLLADLDGDGVDEIIGRIADQKSGQRLVAAFSGKSFQLLWSAGPYRFDGAASHLAFAGDRILVADDGANLVVLERATGKERSRIRLADRLRGDICVSPDAATAWLTLNDYEELRVDLATSVVGHQPRPSSCARAIVEVPAPASSVLASSGIERPVALMSRGSNEAAIVVVGSASSASGASLPAPSASAPPSPSSAAPTTNGPPVMIGLVDGHARWKLPLATAAKDGRVRALAVADGLAYVAYDGAGAARARLAAIDLIDGSARFDVGSAHPSEADQVAAMTIGKGRVYLAHRAWLDVFDAKTGALLGTVGDVGE
jgi:hypothetical protein